MRRIALLISAATLLAGCSYQLESVGVNTPSQIPGTDLDPYGYDHRDVSVIRGVPFHAAGELKAVFKFTWPWDHPETWSRPDMPNYPTEHPYPWND